MYILVDNGKVYPISVANTQVAEDNPDIYEVATIPQSDFLVYNDGVLSVDTRLHMLRLKLLVNRSYTDILNSKQTYSSKNLSRYSKLLRKEAKGLANSVEKEELDYSDSVADWYDVLELKKITEYAWLEDLIRTEKELLEYSIENITWPEYPTLSI